ncbi:hypothetical protein [Paenibacillus sp. CECT 9249]|uniref:hypothetical protein n=1 Tax=Paenibacillus sp. CECT 9249 TaxID=2845385 RepID=UPI001E3D5EB0|nr:hypothetical protein [Paenibacillus sp. CECT 9249]
MNRSPINDQSFIWIAEYYDNTFLSEYDFQTKRKNDFYAIDKNRLTKFGLIGEGSQVFFEVGNGIFDINGHRLMLTYQSDHKEYPLTGRALVYNDIITYKLAASDAKLFMRHNNGRFTDTVLAYNVGYKKKMRLLDANIDYQCILAIPFDDAAYLQIKITSDQNMDGKILIRRNGLIVDEIHAPLKAGHSGQVNWVIR